LELNRTSHRSQSGIPGKVPGPEPGPRFLPMPVPYPSPNAPRPPTFSITTSWEATTEVTASRDWTNSTTGRGTLGNSAMPGISMSRSGPRFSPRPPPPTASGTISTGTDGLFQVVRVVSHMRNMISVTELRPSNMVVSHIDACSYLVGLSLVNSGGCVPGSRDAGIEAMTVLFSKWNPAMAEWPVAVNSEAARQRSHPGLSRETRHRGQPTDTIASRPRWRLFSRPLSVARRYSAQPR